MMHQVLVDLADNTNRGKGFDRVASPAESERCSPQGDRVRPGEDMEKKTILLVEDNPDDAALALRALRKSQIVNEVIVARDGVEALDYLFGTGSYAGRELSVMPVVVLLDLKLPKMDGLDVLRRIRSDDRTRLLPVVILTSSDEQRDLVESYELGANSYVRKPVDFTQFAESVQNLNLYWLLLNRCPPGVSAP